MASKRENKSQLKAALKALGLNRNELLAWKEYGDRVVIVTHHGQKLVWQAKTKKG